MHSQVNRFISQKFRFYSFVCIALLVFVHGYNLKVSYLAPWSTVDEPLRFTTFFEYFIANGFLRFRIPLLFLISGYIYAMQDDRPYLDRTKKRVKTLLAPYFIWSAVGLAITFLLQQFPITAQAVLDAQVDQLGDNRPYTEIGWGGIFTRWTLIPVSFQLWFLRSLFIYNLCYPLFRWMLEKIPVIWLSITAFFWVSYLNVHFIEGQGMFFFSMGIFLQKRNFRIDRKPKWLSLFIAWVVFIGICIMKTFMAFELDGNSTTTFYVIGLLYPLASISGVIAVWYGSDKLVNWCMQRKWFIWASAFSFFIFGLHSPLLSYLTRLAYIYWDNFPYYRLLTYIVVPVFTVLFCIAVGALVRKIAPRAYRIATGGRGF